MRKKSLLISLIVISWLGFVALAGAQARNTDATSGLPGSEAYATAPSSCTDIQNFSQLVNCISGAVFKPLLTLLLTFALVLFLWGVVQYLRKLGSKDAEEAKKIMWWGIIALFVMVSVWGLVGILTSTFGLNNSSLPTPGIPQF